MKLYNFIFVFMLFGACGLNLDDYCHIPKEESFELVNPTVQDGSYSFILNDRHMIFLSVSFEKGQKAVEILKNNPTINKPKNTFEIVIENTENRVIFHQGQEKFIKENAILFLCDDEKSGI